MITTHIYIYISTILFYNVYKHICLHIVFEGGKNIEGV